MLQEVIIEYLESKGWYFDWDHINEVWGRTPKEIEHRKTHPHLYGEPESLPLNERPDAIRTLHGWTVPQWGEYWSSDHLDPVGPKPKERRYENLKDALWSQLLREEEPTTYECFFKDR